MAIVSVPELRDLHPQAWADAGHAWQDYTTKLRHRSEDLSKHCRGLDHWHGEAADAADKRVTGLHAQLTETIAVIERISPVLFTACDDITIARDELRRALYDAWLQDLDVTDAGSVSIVGRSTGYIDPDVLDDIQRRINQALNGAAEADHTATAALHKLLPATSGVAPASTVAAAAKPPPLPPPGTSPQDINQWWNSLSPMQQEAAIYHYGRGLGRLDGIPTAVRDRANQAGLAEAKGMLQERIARLSVKHDLAGAERAELAEAERNLGGINAIEKRLESGGEPQHYLMKLDPNNLGRAIVATGNPDTADNVATLVPGTKSSLGGINGPLEDAANLYEQANYAAPSETTAVIGWQGYAAPQNVVEAASPEYAQNAREELDRFQEGLQATDQGNSAHHTVIGHSYGSTVVGHTARDMGLATDEVVFIGSPGVGVDHASELGLPPESVHASVAENDIIQITNPEPEESSTPPPYPHPRSDEPLPEWDPLGEGPTEPEFGANTFNSDPGPSGWFGSPTIAAHTSYYETGSASLVNMAKIAVGKEAS